jgi:hypothetical protein
MTISQLDAFQVCRAPGKWPPNWPLQLPNSKSPG